MEHQGDNWERQREQLSALLDNELSEQERAELESHLPTCAACRAELVSLRRARDLVRALPQPALPRSFALPLEASSIHEPTRQSTSAARPPSASERRRPGEQPTRLPHRRPLRALQWLSSIAAVLGIVVLLSGLFTSHTFMSAATGTSALSSTQEQAAGAPAPTGTPPSAPERTPNDTHPGVGTQTPPTEAPAATPTTDEGHTLSQNPTPGTPSSPFISATGLGFLLLLLSACGFAIAWALRRRW